MSTPLLLLRLFVRLLYLLPLLAWAGLVIGFEPAHRAVYPVDAAARVTLNEYMAIPDRDGVEYVELLIGGSAPLSADRIAIRDANVSWRLLPSEAGLLMPGQFVVATSDTTIFVGKHGRLPEGARLLELRPWPALNNGGDSLLVAVDGAVVDRVGWTAAEVVRGTSRERISPVLPGSLDEAWTTSTSPPGTPGYRNATYVEDNATPQVLAVEWVPPDTLLVWVDEPINIHVPADAGSVRMGPSAAIPGLAPISLECETPEMTVCDRLQGNLGPDWRSRFTPDDRPVFDWRVETRGLVDLWGNQAALFLSPVHVPPGSGDVRFSEVMSRGAPEFVELVVDAERPVSLRNTILSSSRTSMALADPDAPLVLSPDAVFVVEVDVLTTGETLVLRDRSKLGPTGPTVDSVRVGPDLEDARFRSHQDRSLRRVGGAARDWASSLSPPSTPGMDSDRDLRRRAAPPSPTSSLPPLVLTEVMYDPLMDPHDHMQDQTAFLEWTNGSTEPVQLFGAHLLYEMNERGERDTLRVGYQPMTIPPDSSVVLAWVPTHVEDDLVEDELQSRTFLADIWPETPFSARVLPVRASLGLRNSGRELTLVDDDGNFLSNDVYSPDAHHPMVEVTKGRSLERRRLRAGWSQLETSVHALGATPGQVAGISRPGMDTGSSSAAGSGASPTAHVEPRSFYPDHPELGASAHVVVQTPPEKGPRLATITVFSRHGHPVRRLANAQPVSGTASYIWDGRDDSGTVVPAGIHIILVRLGDAPARHIRLPVAVLRR